MTESNWRARQRAELWERLCRLSDELHEITLLWWDEDSEMASWDPDGPSIPPAVETSAPADTNTPASTPVTGDDIE